MNDRERTVKPRHMGTARLPSVSVPWIHNSTSNGRRRRSYMGLVDEEEGSGEERIERGSEQRWRGVEG